MLRDALEIKVPPIPPSTAVNREVIFPLIPKVSSKKGLQSDRNLINVSSMKRPSLGFWVEFLILANGKIRV